MLKVLDREKKVIIAFCDNNMDSKKTSETVHYCKSYTNKILKGIKDKTGIDPRKYKDLKVLESIARKGEKVDTNKNFEEYVKRYANDHCNGNVEEAKKHAIVKCVKRYYEEN